jgi:WD40 repeat protein
MAVDLYLACRECSCAEHTQLNARHELAAGLSELGWTPKFGDTASEWLAGDPDFGLESEPARAILGFAEVHPGHTLGIVGADDLFAWPWRQEGTPLPSLSELETALGAKRKAEREVAARLARYRDAPELIAPLLRVLAKDRALSVRGEAALSLASLANSQGLEGEALRPILDALSAALEHPKPAARAAATLALALLASGRPGEVDVYKVAIQRAESVLEEVAGRLEAALQAEDAPRVELLRALGGCARAGSGAAILAELRSDQAPVQQAATQALRVLADSGNLPAEFAEQLLVLAEEALDEDSSLRVQQSWGQVLLACGSIGAAALKRLYRTRGLCFFQAQAALCGSAPGRDPLVGQEGRVPRRRAEIQPEHLSFLSSPSSAQSGPRPESFFELDLAGDLLVAQRADGLSVIWDLKEDRILRELWHEPDAALRRRDPARRVALSPSGEVLATGTTKGQIRLWSLSEGTLLRELQAPGCSRLRFGPQGARILVGTPAGVVAWSVASGEVLRRYPIQHEGDVVAARLAACGELLATCGRSAQRRPDPVVHLWQRSGEHPSGCEHRASLEHEHGVLDLAWSPCGTKLATLGSKKQLVIWSAAGERLREHATLFGKTVSWPEPDAIVVSGAGKQLVVHRGETRTLEGAQGGAFAGEGSGAERRWVSAGSKGEAILEAHGQEPQRLQTGSERLAALACRAGLIATVAREGKSSQDSLLRWWGLEETHREARLTKEATAYRVEISPDGARLAVMSQRRVSFWDAETGAQLWERPGQFYELGSLEFSPDGAQLLIPSKADSLTRNPGWVEVVDAATGESLERLFGVQDPGAFELSSDGRRLVTGGAWATPRGQATQPGPALVWDLESAQLLRVLREEGPAEGPVGKSLTVSAASLAPEGRLLASAGWKEVSLWDLDEGARRWQVSLPARSVQAGGVSFDPSGAWLAVGTDQDEVLVYRVSDGEEVARISRQGEARGYPPAIAPRFLPDGRLAWGRLQLEVFDLPAVLAERPPETLELPGPFPSASPGDPLPWTTLSGYVSGLAVSDQVLIAASGEGELVAFELSSLGGQPQERWRSRPFPQGVRALALSPSGTWLACAGWGGELEVFDAASGEQLQSLERGPTWVGELGFLGEDHVWGVLDPGLAGPWNTSGVGLWDLASGLRVLQTSGTCAASAGERLVVGASDARFNAPLYSEDPLELQAAKRNRVPAPLALFKGAALGWGRLLEVPCLLGGAPQPEIGPKESHGGQRALAFSPNGKTLAIARAEPGLSDLVLLEVGVEREEGALIVSGGAAKLLAWRSDGRALAFADCGGEASVVDLTSHDTSPFSTKLEEVTALSWAGERLLIGTERGQIWGLAR